MSLRPIDFKIRWVMNLTLETYRKKYPKTSILWFENFKLERLELLYLSKSEIDWSEWHFPMGRLLGASLPRLFLTTWAVNTVSVHKIFPERYQQIHSELSENELVRRPSTLGQVRINARKIMMMYSTILHQIHKAAISQLKHNTKVTSFSCDQHYQPTRKIAEKGKYPSGYVYWTISQLSPKFWLHKVHLLWKVILTMIRAFFLRTGRACRVRCVPVACIMKF